MVQEEKHTLLQEVWPLRKCPWNWVSFIYKIEDKQQSMIPALQSGFWWITLHACSGRGKKKSAGVRLDIRKNVNCKEGLPWNRLPGDARIFRNETASIQGSLSTVLTLPWCTGWALAVAFCHTLLRVREVAILPCWQFFLMLSGEEGALGRCLLIRYFFVPFTGKAWKFYPSGM